MYPKNRYDPERRPLKKNDKALGMVKIDGCRCRCGHEWRPHNVNEKPRQCPECKSANWDRPKRNSRKRGG